MAKSRDNSNSEIVGPELPAAADVATSPAAPPTAASPESAAGPAVPALKRYLVSLPRHKSLMKDPADPDKNILVDELPVMAETPGDAIQRFNELNGITATIHKHVVKAA